MIIYNLFPLLVGKLHDWERHVERAAAMGFDWILVNPIQKPGRSGSLYSIADHFQINPRFLDQDSSLSPEDQVRAAVRAANRHGLRVMVDLVINHCAVDSEITRIHPEWFRRGPDNSITHPFCSDNGKVVVWRDLVSFNHERMSDSSGFYPFIYSIAEYLIQLGFAAFRCDAAPQIPGEFWHRLMSDVKRHYPNTLFVADTLGYTATNTAQTAQAGFDFILNSSKWWDFQSDWLLRQYQLTREVTSSISFPEDHDTERLFQEMNGNVNGLKQRCLFASFFSSGSLIPIGFEFGFRKRLHVAKTRPEDWEPANVDLRAFITQINTVKARYRLFNEECPTSVLSHDNRNVLVLWKGSVRAKEEALIILNKDVLNSQRFQVDSLNALMQSGAPLKDVSPECAVDYLSSEQFSYDLRPGQGMVLISSPSEADGALITAETQYGGSDTLQRERKHVK
jgi:starch synthase (maltosyl-transferring)